MGGRSPSVCGGCWATRARQVPSTASQAASRQAGSPHWCRRAWCWEVEGASRTMSDPAARPTARPCRLMGGDRLLMPANSWWSSASALAAAGGWAGTGGRGGVSEEVGAIHAAAIPGELPVEAGAAPDRLADDSNCPRARVCHVQQARPALDGNAPLAGVQATGRPAPQRTCSGDEHPGSMRSAQQRVVVLHVEGKQVVGEALHARWGQRGSGRRVERGR